MASDDHAEAWAHTVAITGFAAGVGAYLLGYPLLGIIVVVADIAFATSYRNPVQRAEAKAQEAQFKAMEAAAKQQARLAGKDAPLAVSAQIALMKAEAEIKFWAEQQNADKVLEFTRKKHQLEKELKNG